MLEFVVFFFCKNCIVYIFGKVHYIFLGKSYVNEINVGWGNLGMLSSKKLPDPRYF